MNYLILLNTLKRNAHTRFPFLAFLFIFNLSFYPKRKRYGIYSFLSTSVVIHVLILTVRCIPFRSPGPLSFFCSSRNCRNLKQSTRGRFSNPQPQRLTFTLSPWPRIINIFSKHKHKLQTSDWSSHS